MLRMVEEATHAGYPMDAAAVLLIELEGLHEKRGGAGGADSRGLPALPRARIPRGADRPRSATCSGRAARTPLAPSAASVPSYYVQDGVVPRTQIAPTLRLHRARSREQVRADHQQHLPRGRRQHAPDHSVRCAQARRPGKGAAGGRGHSASTASQVGGSITGEHGVGMEKKELMADHVLRRNARNDERLRDCSIPNAGSIRARCCPRARAVWKSGSGLSWCYRPGGAATHGRRRRDHLGAADGKRCGRRSIPAIRKTCSFGFCAIAPGNF